MTREMRRTFCAIIFIQCVLISVSSQSFSNDTKERFLNGFLSYLKGLPNEPYLFEEGIVSDLQYIDNNNYRLDASLKVSDISNGKTFKLLKCTATITDSPEGAVFVEGHTCKEAEQDGGVEDTGAGEEEALDSSTTTVAYEHNKPVQLYNEVQRDSSVTSGEQFVAIPRSNPLVPCIGCSVHVDPEAQGVTELASLGVRHIDKHEPGVKHSLNSVIDVERQVQVVNGVRYVLTLLVDYNICKNGQLSSDCLEVKPCKISILEKPWVKLNDGSKYRAIVANNCTAEWLYGDNGEVITNDDHNRADNEINPGATTGTDDIGYDYPKPQTNYGPDDNIQQVHHMEVQEVPQFEKHLTEADIKNIEDQIVPYKDYTTENSNTDSQVDQTDSDVQKTETSNLYSTKLNPVKQNDNIDSIKLPGIAEDKKKAIDDLMNFFSYAGLDYKDSNSQTVPHQFNVRSKRSFSNDLQVLGLLEKYNKLKKQVDNAKYMYEVGEKFINIINERHGKVKYRHLQEVLAAEEDNGYDKRYLYMKVRVTMPQLNSASNNINLQSEICNGILDITTRTFPVIVDYFCHRDTNQVFEINSVNNVPLDDPVLINLSKLALTKIETEAKSSNAMKIQKIVDASTQSKSGALTKITLIIVNLNCNKTMPLFLRSDCKILEDEGSKLCDVTIHKNQRNKNTKISYTCDNKDLYETFTNSQQPEIVKTENDSNLEKFVQEAVQYLESQSNSINKLKLVEIKSVKSQIVTGVLTNIEFTVGYTNCENNGLINDLAACTLLSDQPLRKCETQIWIRPWLEGGKQMNVSCSDNTNGKNNMETQVNVDVHNRYTRSDNLYFVGGQKSQNINDSKYKILAEKSLQKLEMIEYKDYKVMEIVNITTQVVAGKLTRMVIKIAPPNCHSNSSCDADNVLCKAKIWERPWLNSTEITTTCEPNIEDRRKKRDTTFESRSFQKKQDPSKPLYKKLSEESLKKYYGMTGSTQHYKIMNIKNVSTQTVSGKLTNIDFFISPTNCQLGADGEPTSSNCQVLNPDNLTPCHSEVWEQPWLKSKKITTKCNGDRVKRHGLGNEREGDRNDPTTVALVEEALLQYSKKQKVHHRLRSVDHVTKKLVSGTIYNIDFTAFPFESSKHNGLKSARRKTNVISYCHARIWSKNWLNKNEITVSCNEVNVLDESNEAGDTRDKRNVENLIDIDDSASHTHDSLLKKALQKYQVQKRLKYVHKIVDINTIHQSKNDGTPLSIEFTISPTNCLVGTEYHRICKVNNEKKICHVIFKDLDWIEMKDISISCNKVTDSLSAYTFDGDVSEIPEEVERMKRETRLDDELEEDLKFYYADRAVEEVNNLGKTQNLQKLISVHSTHTSRHMDTTLVRLYIETAMTYCIRDHKLESDLQNCAEVEGLNHKMCLARIWPSPEDEFTIHQISVVCDDDENFNTVTGLSASEMIQATLKEVESSPDVVYKMIPYGEPHLIPSLESSVPTKLNFIVATTNCTKDADIYSKKHDCVIDTTVTSKICRSLIWMVPNTRKFLKIRASCKSPVKTSNIRNRRDAAPDIGNTTVDDIIVKRLVEESIKELEMSSLHVYKQRLLKINRYSSKINTGKVTTIDFEVAYTSCLKFEYIINITDCKFLDYLPRRHCISNVYERLWLKNGHQIEVKCEDAETPLGAHVEFENAETGKLLAEEALKHIEAKYPHPKKMKVVRVFSLEKQLVAGIHYRMKLEVGLTNCPALSPKTDCNLSSDQDVNRFCRVNIWVRPWTDNPPNYRVSCDYQDGASSDEYHQIQAEHLFFEFLMSYRPKYLDDPVETKKRFEVFRNNIKRIHELNVHERGTARYGVTSFSDLTYEEFASKYTGLKPKLRDSNYIPMRKATIPDIAPPEKFDWRDYDAVTEVKNQGSCGSCWAFSVTGNIEGQWKLSKGKLISLSEQELVDCDKMDSGCNGGLMDNAYRAVEELGGLETENDYPYEGEDDKCSFNKTMSKVQISGAVNITTNETDIAKWLAKNGPISIGINANAMQFYVGGVSHPWRMLCNPSNLDHGVLLVGYGVKDYPLFNKRLPYWIVKNSWGTSWGEQGYYRVYRGDGTCGVNQMASSAIV